MSITLDGQDLFDTQHVEIDFGSLRRDSIERSVAGVDGVLSIDLGSRGREIKQKGVLRAKSNSQMDERIDAISNYLDGDSHTLVTGDGETIGNLRMDVFKASAKRTSGGGVAVDYEIVYTQLVV